MRARLPDLYRRPEPGRGLDRLVPCAPQRTVMGLQGSPGPSQTGLAPLIPRMVSLSAAVFITGHLPAFVLAVMLFLLVSD